MLIALAAWMASAGQPGLASALKCDFDSGVFHAWGEKTQINSDHFSLIYNSINVKSRTARLIGNIGASDIAVVESVGHLTFLEVTPSGNVTVTTVYTSGKKLPYPAVHSRHVGLQREPWGSQMYGSCSPN